MSHVMSGLVVQQFRRRVAPNVFGKLMYTKLPYRTSLICNHNTYRQDSDDDTSSRFERTTSWLQMKSLGTGALIFFALGIGFIWEKYHKGIKCNIRKFIVPTVVAAIPNDASIPPNSDGGGGARKTHNFIADVVHKCNPSVVYIEIIDKLFNRVVSNGSGFVVSEDGLILTNAHVVTTRGHNIVQVKLHNGHTYVGQIESADMTSDLALVRINCRNLPVMKLGVSSELQAGEWVVAIGSPLSLSNTVTAGVVSSTNRKGTELGIHGRGIDYIQTDASITFGNSGGPLVNLDGEAIGINSMKITAGISFAIPIDYAKGFLEKSRLKSKGFFSKKSETSRQRRYMGVTMATLTPHLLMALQEKNMISSPVTHGVFVVKVVIGSPAYNGGLKPGDIVTHINSKLVESTADIYAALEAVKTLEITVMRGKETLDLLVVAED